MGSNPIESSTDLVWLAGYIDGDGSITMSYKSSKDRLRTPVVTIDSCDVELIQEVQRIAGGSIRPKRVSGDNCRAVYSWKISGKNAVKLLERVLPYIRCGFKKRRAACLAKGSRLFTGTAGGRAPAAWVEARLCLERDFFMDKEAIGSRSGKTLRSLGT